MPVSVASERPRKRPRPTTETAPSFPSPSAPSSRLFAPFRALGLVTNHVPFVLQTRSSKNDSDQPRVHILTCLARSWALWDAAKMNLLFVGPDEPENLAALAMDGDAVWAAVGPSCVKYIRGKRVAQLHNPYETQLSSIIVIGNHLVVLTADGAHLLIWNSETGDFLGSLDFDPGFMATAVLHPATYLNKVLIGSAKGGLQLWNIRTRTCIHKFETSWLCDTANSNSPITCLVQSPAIDVVGIGFGSGEISVYDIRADERLMRMFMDGGAVRALSFRTDGQPVLASASSTGHVTIWDLNGGGHLLHVLRGAHDGAATATEWILGQPVLVTAGEDNSVKQWVFDSPTSPPRLLKFRSGHHAPPHIIRYYGEDGKQLLTASDDRSLRCTSVVRDSRSFELSQGHLAKKATSLSIPLASLRLPPITSLSYSSVRSKDWDDVLTSHLNEPASRTWTVRDKKLGKHTFTSSPGEKGKKTVGCVKIVCVTACGNFGLSGSSTGVINMWNMQSGIHRKSFGFGATPASGDEDAHAVTGLATDSLNRNVIASTSAGLVSFFDFHSTKLEHTVTLPAGASSLSLHRDSGLLAVVCKDLTVRILDIETHKVVRELSGFQGRILDVAFSLDSRWLLTTSSDSIIRTFDLPTGRLVDAFRTPSVATTLALSPTDDFLATAHENSVGIFLWANRAQYSDLSLAGLPSSTVIEDVAMPSMQSSEEGETADMEPMLLGHVPQATDVFLSPAQLNGELVTLTLLPRSRWQTLLNLEVIQHRNRPKEPPKQPQKAPFFLPTVGGVETRFAVEKPHDQDLRKDSAARRLKPGATIGAESMFNQKLSNEDVEGDYETLFAYVKTLSPAAIDLEIRSLSSLASQITFVRALKCRIQSHRDFEAIQTFLNVFLRIHGEMIVANAELRSGLEELLVVQKAESARLLQLMSASLGTLGFVREIL